MKERKTMHCWNCGKKMTAVAGNYEYDDKCLGHLSVPCKAGEMFTCDCGKTPKYRNRIYHVVMNGDLLWWKPSVALFKSKGDGRFVFGKAKPTALKRLRAFGELLREFMPLRSAAMFTF